jgi:programmed cell death protein 5
MDELEEIRKRKLAEMQSQAQEQQAAREQQEAAARQQLAQLEHALRQALTPDAWEQWSMAKVGNAENAYLAGATILRYIQAGQLHPKVNKEQVRAILSEVGKQTRREFNIKRL